MAACSDAPSAELRRGIEQFNRREFFACHETLEALWLAEPGPVRQLYQGVLQVGVGFYHLQRGNRNGGLKCLARGYHRLRELPPICQGIAVHKLARDSFRALEWLQGQGSTGRGELEEPLIPNITIVIPPLPATGISTSD